MLYCIEVFIYEKVSGIIYNIIYIMYWNFFNIWEMFIFGIGLYLMGGWICVREFVWIVLWIGILGILMFDMKDGSFKL